MKKHQKYVSVSNWTVPAETLLKIGLSILNKIISNHISGVSSCTVQLNIDTYFWCVLVHGKTRYSHIFLMFLRVI